MMHTSAPSHRLYEAFLQSRPTHVLLVETSTAFRTALTEVLSQEGYDVTAVGHGQHIVNIAELQCRRLLS